MVVEVHDLSVGEITEDTGSNKGPGTASIYAIYRPLLSVFDLEIGSPIEKGPEATSG
jgi:hypothetical protein